MDGKKIALHHKMIVPGEYAKRTSDSALFLVDDVSDNGDVMLRPIGPDGEMQEPVLWAFELVHKQLVHTKDRVEVVEDWRKMAPFEQHTATESLVKAYALAALRDTSALHRPMPELRVQLKPQVRVFAKQAHKAFSIYLTPDTHRFVILEEDDETPQHGFVITIPTGTGDDVWRVVPQRMWAKDNLAPAWGVSTVRRPGDANMQLVDAQTHICLGTDEAKLQKVVTVTVPTLVNTRDVEAGGELCIYRPPPQKKARISAVTMGAVLKKAKKAQ